MKLKLILLLPALLIVLQLQKVTAQPLPTDTVRKILVKRTTFDYLYSAAAERDRLCKDLNTVNLKLGEKERVIERKNTWIKAEAIAIGILGTILFFR